MEDNTCIYGRFESLCIALFLSIALTTSGFCSYDGEVNKKDKIPDTKEISLKNSITNKKRVLILNAYHESFHWTDRIMKGIRTVFEEEDIELFINYMDTKRCSDTVYFEQLKNLYLHKYQNFQFDAILSTDDHALNFLLKNRDNLFPNVPVVFCGINDFQPSRIANHELFTGVYETYDIAGTLNLIRQLHPKVNAVTMVNDASFSGEAFLSKLERVEPEFEGSLNFQYLTDNTLEELSYRLGSLSSDAAVIWGIYLRTPNGQILTSKESVELVASYTNQPVYCIWDVVGQGVVGGKITSPFFQGKKAANMIVRILQGENSSQIPVSGSPMVYKFDYRLLKRFNISESELPADSVIINHPFTLIKKYRKIIWLVTVIIVLLLSIVISLMYLIRKSKKAEAEILVSHNKLSTVSIALKETNTKLEKAKKKAEESDQLKTTFLANLSHEIRTPMNGILGFAELLEEKDLPVRQQHEYLNVIRKSGQRMLELINNLVDISKIETGQIILNKKEVHLNSLMSGTYTFFIPHSEQKSLSLNHHNGLPNSECTIITDGTRLEQVLTNLISNALKFTKEGSVSFMYEKLNDNLRFVVKDTGPGVPAELQKKIFERFRQAGDTPFREEEGSGLGLAISKSIVELMGGEIGLRSTTGIGTEFFFTIPYTPANRKTEITRIKAKENLKDGLTIIVAEDDEVCYSYLKEILSKENVINLIWAKNGKEAIKMLEYHPETDLILMDIKMPVLNGIEAVKIIRESNTRIPIIAQTAYTAEVNKQKAYHAGCNSVVTKPIDKEKLKKTIMQYVVK